MDLGKSRRESVDEKGANTVSGSALMGEMMKNLLLTAVIAFVFGVVTFGFGQQLAPEKAEELYNKAKWVQVVVDEDQNPFFIDSLLMDRIRDVVAFRTKTEIRGTIKYHTMLGGCDDNRVLQTNGFAVYPGSPEFVSLDDKTTFTVKSGTIGFRLLDYACKNAKITVLTSPTPAPTPTPTTSAVEEQLQMINLGSSYEKEGRFTEAIEQYNKVLQLNPNHAVALYNRGSVYSKLSKYDLAIADYSNVIQTSPQFSLAYYNRGNAYDELGRYDLAISDYTNAIRVKPRYLDAYNNRANVYGKQGKIDLAIADYTEAIQLSGQNSARLVILYNNRGQSYDDQDKTDLAIADYTKAIQLDPRYEGSYLNRGGSFGKHGNFVPAIADFTTAIQLNPKDARAFRNRAYAYCLTGQKNLARADEMKVIALGQKLNRKCE